MKLSDIHIRDPYILPDGGKYYLYGTRGCMYGAETGGARKKAAGFDVYEGGDLAEWSGPREIFHRPEGFWADRDFWAPEVHRYGGRYYLFASFKSETRRRGTQILVADSPAGPFLPHSDGPVTPAGWECLDGTLYLDGSGAPYLVFSHEWVQVRDGEMCALRLSADLKEPAGAPFLLFRASEPSWALKGGGGFAGYITDGPFLYRTSEGRLLLLWSSFSASGYVEAVAWSDSGEITGKWRHCDAPLFPDDGGHGMVFRAYDGRLLFVMHTPNESPKERPVLKAVFEKGGTLSLG